MNTSVLLTITDGKDNRDQKAKYYSRAIDALRKMQIFSLSCGIGSVDVDHAGLTSLAQRTGGLHIDIRHSQGIAVALSLLTTHLVTQILDVSQPHVTSQAVARRDLQMMQTGVVRSAVDLFILIGCSWSMLGLRSDASWTGDKQKLPRSKAAAIEVIRTLNANHDRVGVGRFWEDYRKLRSLSSNFERCISAIRDINGDSGTALYRSIYLATQEF